MPLDLDWSDGLSGGMEAEDGVDPATAPVDLLDGFDLLAGPDPAAPDDASGDPEGEAPEDLPDPGTEDEILFLDPDEADDAATPGDGIDPDSLPPDLFAGEDGPSPDDGAPLAEEPPAGGGDWVLLCTMPDDFA